ncbi:MAG: DUF3878 family protein [Clostridiales bacterium]|nr:DUF3878 family protein [Clostridiales bacterium]
MNQSKVTEKQLESCIRELIDCGALELLRCLEGNPNDMYIPYMMNDALEYYFILTECTAIGELKTEFPVGTTVETVQGPQGSGLVLRRPDGTLLTLQYQQAQEVRQLYQYHTIGHFWRDGQEQWRQLVYIIGTIYDKWSYIGAESCNTAEQELLPLMTFAPFRYWSPIHEELDFYPDSEEGLDCMALLAKQAGDTAYLSLLRQYQKQHDRDMTERLAKELAKPERRELYRAIWKKLSQAASGYPERDYGIVLNTKIAAERRQVTELLYQYGFQGRYPCFRRDTMQVVAAEEHPFTVFGLEYADFTFRIQFMVSETRKPQRIWNAGFFEGTGRIAHSLQELEAIV